MKHQIVYIALVTILTLVCFQNCGQQGSLTIEPDQALPKPTTDTMIIDPNGVINTDGGTPPAGSSPGNQAAGGGTNNPPQPVISQSLETCSRIDIADFLLKVESISVSGDSAKQLGDAIVLEEPNASISLNKLHITIRAIKSVSKVSGLFMVLKSDGNKVLDMEDMSYDMKTPSGQTAGIKVRLSSAVSLKAGEIYSVQFSINPDEQIVSNPVKCLFKPVIKDARIVEALVHAL